MMKIHNLAAGMTDVADMTEVTPEAADHIQYPYAADKHDKDGDDNRQRAGKVLGQSTNCPHGNAHECKSYAYLKDYVHIHRASFQE